MVLFTLIIVYILIKNLFNEQFSNNYHLKNLFHDKDLFTNKTIFLIANNSNLSEKTQEFLNKYNFDDNSLIIRFNGYKPVIKDYAQGKTDIMIYRKNAPGKFHGYNKNHSSNVLNVFTEDSKHSNYLDNFDKNGYVNVPLHVNFDKINNSDNKFMFTEMYFDNLKKKKYYTTGFNILLLLLNLTDYKKIYLIGYTFHNKSENYWHNMKYEYEYYKKNIENKYNVEILL